MLSLKASSDGFLGLVDDLEVGLFILVLAGIALMIVKVRVSFNIKNKNRLKTKTSCKKSHPISLIGWLYY